MDLGEGVTRGHGWTDYGEREIVHGPMRHKVRIFMKGGCRVLVSREDHKAGKIRYHLSISHPDRYPSWEEIKDARYSLLPVGMTFAQILPPMNEYTNIHPNCFHLWEIDHAEW